jgi:hypothetical protein
MHGATAPREAGGRHAAFPAGSRLTPGSARFTGAKMSVGTAAQGFAHKWIAVAVMVRATFSMNSKFNVSIVSVEAW